MKIAIVHDELTRRGGAEQVVLSFQKAFPSAPIYTMVYKADLTYPEFRSSRIFTSWFQRIALNEKIMKYLFFPFGMLAMMQMRIKGYDVILISSTYAAKYPDFDKGALVVNYCHQPFRLAWSPESYKQYADGGLIKKNVLQLVINFLKKIDFKKAGRANFYITNSVESREKIKRFYRPEKEVEIIHPAVKCSNFHVTEGPKEFYLVVSRLEYYKRIDLAIDAFNILGKPLIIVGKGSLEKELRARASSNIVFKGSQTSEALASLLSGCKALIFPQHEDFGITPLEANASGRPVIAYGRGGVLETMIPFNGQESSTDFTAVFFSEQTVSSLLTAISTFEKLHPDPGFIRSHSESFDESVFIDHIKKFVIGRYESRKTS
jgi:glycosyltransferase involved in cell wall biosynthesis